MSQTRRVAEFQSWEKVLAGRVEPPSGKRPEANRGNSFVHFLHYVRLVKTLST